MFDAARANCCDDVLENTVDLPAQYDVTIARRASRVSPTYTSIAFLTSDELVLCLAQRLTSFTCSRLVYDLCPEDDTLLLMQVSSSNVIGPLWTSTTKEPLLSAELRARRAASSRDESCKARTFN